MSAHIDDTLIFCKSIATLHAFKSAFLHSFQGMGLGPVTESLGCYIVHDCKLCILNVNQTAYIQKILAFLGMADANQVKTPREQGARLPKNTSCPREHL
jgi:hypothetical protein